MIEDDNVIYNRYKNKYPEIEQVMQKCKGIYKKLLSSNKKVLFVDIKDYLESIINSFFEEDESNVMAQYHLHMCMSTGLSVGQFAKESSGEIYNICFLCSINQIFIDLREDEKNEKSSFLNYKSNIIKEGLNKIIENAKENDEEMILLINMLLFIAQNKEVNISNNLLRHARLENIKEKSIVIKSSDKRINTNENIKTENESPLSELCFNNNDFNYINDYFSKTKDSKYLLYNTIQLPLLLSSHLLTKNKNKFNDNSKNKENENKDEKEKIIENTYLLPITYQIILLNIMNLSLNANNKFEFKKAKPKKDFDSFMKNIEDLYKEVLGDITEFLKENKNYKEDGYDKFYKKWKIYKKYFDNNKTIELIRDEIMNNTFILLPQEYEKSKDEEYYKKLSRKNIKLFIIIHDAA